MQSEHEEVDGEREEEEDEEMEEIDIDEYSLEQIDAMNVQQLQEALAIVREQVHRLEEELGEDAYDDGGRSAIPINYQTRRKRSG